MAAPRAFLDILANAQVRDAYLAGRITLILSPDLSILLWANGAGAHFMGFRTVAESLHAESGLSLPARQSIEAALGGKAAVSICGIEGARDFLASRATIAPLGDVVFLRSVAAANAGDKSRSLAVDLTEGLSDETSEAALLDLQGRLMFADKGFNPAILAEKSLPALLDEVYREGGVKKRLLGKSGIYPVGAVMLNKEPPIFLMIAAKPDGEAEEAIGLSGKFALDTAILPLRFFWRTDERGALTDISPELAQGVGPRHADIIGKSFAEIAQAWHMRGGDVLAELLQSGRPWAGQTVIWPIDGNEGNGAQAVLSALPVYAADGQLKGFRGFGLIQKQVSMVNGMSDDMRGQDDGKGRDLDDKEREAFFAIAKRLSQTMPANPGGNQGQGAHIRQEQSFSPSYEGYVQDNGRPYSMGNNAYNNYRDNEQNYSRAAPHQNHADDAAHSHGNRTVVAPPTGQTESEIFAELASSVQTAMREENKLRAARDKLRITEQTALAEQKARGEAEMIKRQIGEAEAARQSREAEVMRQSLHAEEMNRRRAEAESERRIREEAERQRRSMAGRRNAGAEDAQMRHKSAPAAGGADYQQFGSRQNPEAAAAPAAQIIPLPLPQRNPRAEHSVRQAASAFGAPIQPLQMPSFARPAEQMQGADARGEERFRQNGQNQRQAAPMPAMRNAASSDGVNISMREQQPLSPQNQNAQSYSRQNMQAFQPARAQMNSPQNQPYQQSQAKTGQGDAEQEVSHRQVFPPHSEEGNKTQLSQNSQSEQPPQNADSQEPQQTARKPDPGTIEAANMTAAAHMSMQAKRIRELAAEAENLRYQRDRLDFLLNAISESVLVLDKAGMVLSSNEAAARLFGRGSENMRGKSLSILLTPAAAQEMQHEIDQAEAEKSGIFLKPGREIDGRTAQGELLKLRVNFGCLEQGKNYFLLMRDMTRFHDIIASLLRKNNDETESFRRQARYLGLISHEIRTPLSALLGMAQFMAEEKAGPLNNGKYSEYLGDMLRAGKHIMTLLNDIMNVSKEETWLKMDIRPMSLYNVLNDVLSMMIPQANAANIIMRSGVAGDLPPVVADARAVRQMLLNLIGNAVHFTPQGGQIIISAHELHDNAAAAQISPAPRRILVRISDTGIGMTDAEIARSMRDPLQIDAGSGDAAQQDASMKSRMKGAGLGLPMVRALADANHVDFSLSSEQGRGTIATLVFPVAEAENSAQQNDSQEASKQEE